MSVSTKLSNNSENLENSENINQEIDYSRLGLGVVLKDYKNGIVVCSKGFFYTNENTGEIKKVESNDYDLIYIEKVNTNGSVISGDKIVFFDFLGDKKPVEVRVKGKIIDTYFDSKYTRITTEKEIIYFSHTDRKLNREKIKSYGVGEIINITSSNFVGSNGLILQGSKKTLLLNEKGEIEIELSDFETSDLGIIKALDKNGSLSSDIAIRKYFDNKNLKTIYARDLGMEKFYGEFNGSIPGEGFYGTPEIAQINPLTGEVLYRSIDLANEKRDKLNSLGIYDFSRFTSEKMVDHIIYNRENIDKLGKKEIVLIMTPDADYSSAFVKSTPDKFLDGYDILYYENHLENHFKNALDEIQKNLKKGVGIKSFFLWGHGQSDSLMFSYTYETNFSSNRWEKDENYLQVQDEDRYHKYADLFRRTNEIILPSCWTGRDGKEGNNLIHMVANSFGKYALYITGPKKPTTADYQFLELKKGKNKYFGFSFNGTQTTSINGKEFTQNAIYDTRNH